MYECFYQLDVFIIEHLALIKIINQWIIFIDIMINQDMAEKPDSKQKSLKNQMPNIYSGFLNKCPSQLKTFFKKRLKIRNKCNAFFFLLLMCYTSLSQQEFMFLKSIIDKILQKKISFKTDSSKRDIQKYERSLERLQKYQNIIGRIFVSSKLQNLQKWEQLLNEAMKQQNWANLGIKEARQKHRKQAQEEWLKLIKKYQFFLEKVEEAYGSRVKNKQILIYFPIDDKQAENQDIQIDDAEQSGILFEGGEIHNFEQDEKQQIETLVPQFDKKLVIVDQMGDQQQIETIVPQFDQKLVFVDQMGDQQQIEALFPQFDQKLVFVDQMRDYEFDQVQGYFLSPDHSYVKQQTNKHIFQHNGESQKTLKDSKSISQQIA